MKKDISHIRQDYMLQALLEADVDRNPFEQFSKWWDEAIESAITEVNAMALATATKEGMPSVRIVLLKDFSEDGFTFFTNYESNKGKMIAENPLASVVFFWKELERQIRIEGKVKKISAEESDLYFNSRPLGSRIGAWASPQSSPIASRDVIEQKLEQLNKQYTDGAIERPPHWGGYILKPTKLEFWQGRQNRLHDRIQYSLQNNDWKIERLAP